MMVERIIAAFSFRKGIYKEVEEDQSFTNSAWIIVSVVALLSSFGSNAVHYEAVSALGSSVLSLEPCL